MIAISLTSIADSRSAMLAMLASNPLWLETHFAANQGVVCDVVGTVETACDEYTSQRETLSDHEVWLVPVAGLRVSPGRSVVRLEQDSYAAYSMNITVMQRRWLEHKSWRLCPFSFKLPVPKIPMQLGQESRSEHTPAFRWPSRYSCPMARLPRWWYHVPCITGPALSMSVNAKEAR